MALLSLRIPYLAFVALLALPAIGSAQDPPAASDQTLAPGARESKESKRLFFIIPNNRTAPVLKDFKPITSREKFKIAMQDTFDPGTIALAAVFAGQAQLSAASPSFRQGAAGYGRYFAAQYSDFILGNYLTEAILPSALHQDPRYFRKGSGGWSRLGHAAGQIFLTHNDSGRPAVNYSELGGNAAAVAISMSYYPDSRNAKDATVKFGMQISVDVMSNILKEFWPEINRKLTRKRG